MKQYLIRLFELAAAGFLAGGASYVAQNGFEFSEASIRGLVIAAGLAGYGVVVKQLGADKDRPTVAK